MSCASAIVPGARLLASALVAVLLATLLATLGCGEAGDSGESPGEVVAEPWRELPAVEHPDLSSLEGPVRDSLETCRQRLRALLADAATPAPALAEAFVRMAELYHAYGLLSAADTAYANALQLHGGEARWAYELGLLKRRQGQEEEALEAFRQAGQWDPERSEIRLQQGEALLALGRAEEARRLYQDLLAANQKGDGEREAVRAAAFDGLGRAAAALGNLEEAATALGQALEIQPQAGSTRYALAQVERQRGHKERAQALLAEGGRGAVTFPDPWAEALKDLAEGPSALLARGGEALVNGRLEEAETFYQRAVELAPDHVEAQRNLAVALTRRGRFQEAEEVLQAALRRRPGEALLLFDLANAQLAQGQLAQGQLAQGRAEEALSSFDQAIAAAPDFDAARFNQANALMQLQRYGEAEAALRELLAIAPGHAQGRYLQAMAVYQQGRRPEGIQALRQLLAAEPDLFAARLSLASVLAQEGDAEGARREAALALGQPATAQEKASIYALLGQLSKAARRQQEAEAQWRKALELAPQLPEALQALGDLYLETNRPREAAKLYGQLAAARGRDPEPRRRQAVALISAGRFVEARQVLETALEDLGPAVPLVHTLARLLATAPDAAARDGVKALALAQQAYRSQRSVDHAETLAMAMAESGQWQEAVQWQQGLLDQARTLQQPALTQRLETHLRLFESHRPVRIE